MVLWFLTGSIELSVGAIDEVKNTTYLDFYRRRTLTKRAKAIIGLL